MSIDTGHRPTTSSVRATATWLLRMNLYLAAWFWGLAIIVVTAALLLINQVGEVNNSVLAFARQGALWFPFSVLIAITAAYLPVHVAAGLTRRSLALGSLISGLLYGTRNIATGQDLVLRCHRTSIESAPAGPIFAVSTWSPFSPPRVRFWTI